MPTMNGVIKDQTGDELLPRTSFAQVRDEDEKLLSDWRAETDEAVSNLQTRDTEIEESITAVQNAIPDVSGLATKEDVQAVEGQIPDVSGMVTGVSYEESTGTLTLTGADNQTIATVTISTAGTVLKDAKLEQSEGSAMLSLEWQLVNGSTTTTTVDLSTLIDVYKEGTGIKVADNTISVDAVWLAAQMPDTSDLATKSELAEVQSSIPDVSNLASKDEIPDVSGFATKAEVEAVQESIPSIEGLATKEELQAVEDAIPDVSNLSALTSAELEESSLAAGGTEAGDFTFTISFKDAIAGWSDPVSVTVNGNVNESISFTASIEFGKTVGGLPMGQVNYKGEYNGVTAEGYAGTGQIGLDFGTSGYATITSRNLNAAGTGYDLEGTFISYVGYKAGAFLTLTSTSADGATSAITVDLSSLKHTSGLGINIGSDGAISVDETFLSSLLGQLVTQTSFAELEARVAALESGE